MERESIIYKKKIRKNRKLIICCIFFHDALLNIFSCALSQATIKILIAIMRNLSPLSIYKLYE